ncbi:hypothetical protein [Saccharibacillus deserti]|uniref:hypothetical protein n=1 Tax=Saccharibacillus deserti TaxID=1634444 RepID=UPI001553E68D|nr:hypothetical protein [Saccharibacillus deserti]
MALINLNQAIQISLPVRLHAVSGEFYEGVCTRNPKNSSLFDIHIDEEIVTLPQWAVKRIWRKKIT